MKKLDRLTIRAVRTTPIVAPLARPLVTASGRLDRAPLILIDLVTDQGIVGRAYTFVYFPFLLKPLDVLLQSLGELIVGEAVEPQTLEAKLRARFTLIGGTRGLAGVALGGLDVAAWDALGIAAGLPLARMLGAAPRPIRAYNSAGMIRPADVDEVVQETLSTGMKALKIKIGWPTMEEDLDVVRAMRRALPADGSLMVDFNQSLDVAEAIRRGRALDGEGVAWIEEPVRCNDFTGCAEVTKAVETPIQLGENFAGTHDMQAAIAAGASDLLMPDLQQIGGVTGWLRASALAHAAGKRVSSHLFVEANSHLLAATPTCDWLEWLDVTSTFVTEPIAVRDGHVTASSAPGIGMTWDADAVERYRVT